MRLSRSLRSRCAPEVSVVIVSRNEGSNLRKTVEGFRATSPIRTEIIVIDDASTDRSAAFLRRSAPGLRLFRTPGLGVTKARNRGAGLAKGRFVVFADAHVDAPRGWAGPLLAALDGPRVAAAAPCISVMGRPEVRGFGLRLKGADLATDWLPRRDRKPYSVPIVPGCFLAMPRRVFVRTGGFDPGMSTWGMSDIEMSIRFCLQGYELRVVPAVDVPHLFREKHPYQVKWEHVLHNRLRTAFIHFGPSRFARVVEAARDRSEFPQALARLLGGDCGRRRAEMKSTRRHDDDWYFKTFGGEVAAAPRR